MQMSKKKINFEELRRHVGHKIKLVTEGSCVRARCETCHETLNFSRGEETRFPEHIRGMPKLHEIVCVSYGIEGQEPANIAIECQSCCEVLADFDRPDLARRGEVS